LPPLWLYLLGLAAASSLGLVSVPATAYLHGSLFLCNLPDYACTWHLGHTWSLGVEQQFYIVWPLVLLALRWRAVALAALVLAGLFLWLQLGTEVDFFESNGLSYACLAVGCVYAASERFRSGIARHATRPKVGLAVLLLLAEALVPREFLPFQYEAQTVLHPLLICFVIFASYGFRESLERRWAVQWLSWLGLVSYGVYLWQEMFLAPPHLYLKPSLLQVAPLLIVPVLLSYHLLEKPLLELGARISRGLIARGIPTAPRNSPPGPGARPTGPGAPSA